jgi:uncharacterized PurR-regulated membrane protein YhhQ (DUF165 family)
VIGAAKPTFITIGGEPWVYGAGILFFPLGYVIGDVLTEIYGYARARRVIWAGFGALLFNTPLGAGWKMAANVALTTAVCLLAYQTLVRRTWVGRLLNGGRGADRVARP